MAEDLLTPGDLAYMRETQASARPTEALLRRTQTTRTPAGGTTTTRTAGEPVAVRIAAVDPTAVEAAAPADYQVTITMDLVEVRDGDWVAVSPTEVYEVTTDGLRTEWTTAQVVYGRRVAGHG